jgi:hypothetical protein
MKKNLQKKIEWFKKFPLCQVGLVIASNGFILKAEKPNYDTSLLFILSLILLFILLFFVAKSYLEIHSISIKPIMNHYKINRCYNKHVGNRSFSYNFLLRLINLRDIIIPK